MNATLRPSAGRFAALVLAWSLLSPSLVSAERSLVVGTVQSSPGSSTTVPVTFTNDGTVVGLQFDLSYDPAVLSLTGISGGGVVVDHIIESNVVIAGQLRIVVHSPTNASLGSGTLLSLGFDIDTLASGFTPLDRSLVVLGDQAAVFKPPTSLQSGGVDIVGCGSQNVDRIDNLSVGGTEVFEACVTLTAGPNFSVESTGHVTLRAGREVMLENTVQVLDGGVLIIQIDPGLLPP